MANYSREQLREAFQHPNVFAFSMAVRNGESSLEDKAYLMRFGGLGKPTAYFDNFLQHPKIFEPTHGGLKSSAAGAYQATWTTWNEEQQKYGWTSFAKDEQDEFFVARLVYRKALDALIAGRFDEVCRLCKAEWTSLPGGAEQNRATSKAREIYFLHGGTAANPAERPKGVIPMAPALLALVPALIEQIPKLAAVFSSGSERANKNVAAVSMVADAVVKATGAANLQGAIESMASDPEAKQAANAAVDELWPTISDAGGGGIDGARKFAAEHEGDRYGRILEVVSYCGMSFLLFANCMAFAIGWFKNDWSRMEAVIQADIGVALMVFGFFLGSSLGSRRKDP